MALTQRAEVSDSFPDVQHEIVRLAGISAVRSAFAWFLSHEQKILEDQLELARIPAPPFGEQARSGWILERFLETGLHDVHTDEVGNVFGIHPGLGGKLVTVSA